MTASVVLGTLMSILLFTSFKRAKKSLAHAHAYSRKRSLALRKRSFLVTEFKWPTDADYQKELANPEVDTTWGQLDAPYMRLQQNMDFMLPRGAKFHENVDGFNADKWLRTQGYNTQDFMFISWGSPHVELSDGSSSCESYGSAPYQKPYVFSKLVEQFPHALVIVTYTVHHIDNLSVESDKINQTGEWWNVEFVNTTGVSYRPKFSKGWTRGIDGENPIMCLLYIPNQYKNDWTEFFNGDSSNKNWELDYKKLVQYASKKGSFLFLGEERADLARAAFECIV